MRTRLRITRSAGRQREIDLDSQTLTVEVIDHIEQPKATAVSQAIMHKIHRPGVVDCLRNGQWLWFFPHDSLLRFDAEVQLQFPVDAIHALVIPRVAFDVAQKQITQPKSPILLVARQADQPVGNQGIVI